MHAIPNIITERVDDILLLLAQVVFSMWRWTAIDGTLSLVLTASRSKECLMTFIAVRCPHCQSDQIVKRGKTGCGTQRYLCQNPTCATCVLDTFFCLGGFGSYRRLWTYNAVHFSEVH